MTDASVDPYDRVVLQISDHEENDTDVNVKEDSKSIRPTPNSTHDVPLGTQVSMRHRRSTHSLQSFTSGPTSGWNGTTHLAVQLYRTIMQSREKDYVYENDENAEGYIPFLEDWVEISGITEDDVGTFTKDLALFPSMELTFRNLAFSVMDSHCAKGKESREKKILHSISGTFAPGTLVAIMGPSGSGKTTLLDILSQKKTLPYTGEIAVNGHALDKYFTRMTSYVPQFDFGSGLDTVQEAAIFASKMKALYTESEEEMGLRLKYMLKMLGLSKVAESYVGDGQKRGISGGQRRRLTLLKGLITDPGIAFLDEPTSGLSSTDAEICIMALRNLAKLTRTTFITVIHQPKRSVFDMFDHLILLSDGKPVYNGLRSEASDYFASLGHPIPPFTEAADHFLDVITPGTKENKLEIFVEKYNSDIAPRIGKSLETLGKGETLKESLVKGGFSRSKSMYPLSRFQQYCLLQKRDFRHFIRDADEIVTILINNMVLGLLVGLIYKDTYSPTADFLNDPKASYQFAYIFFVLVIASLTALNAVPAMINSRIIFQNERAEGYYDILPYMITKFGTSLVTCAVGGTLTLLLCSYWLAGFPVGQFIFILAVVLVSYISMDAIVAFTSSCATSLAMGNSLAGAVIGILTLFNGFTANAISTPAYIAWIRYLSPFFYGFQAIVVHLYDEKAAAQFGLNTEWGVWGGILIMLGMAVFFRVLQYLALRYANQIVR
eukprot:CFRG3180T1